MAEFFLAGLQGLVDAPVPDVIVTDLDMPIMDGFELIRRRVRLDVGPRTRERHAHELARYGGRSSLEYVRTDRETGLIVTKLDGTAKGGAVVAIAHSLQLPVRYVGVGESPDDLQPFNPREFATALFA